MGRIWSWLVSLIVRIWSGHSLLRALWFDMRGASRGAQFLVGLWVGPPHRRDFIKAYPRYCQNLKSGTTSPRKTMTVSHEPHDVDSTMQFIRADSKVNRRYITPGAEINTGKYEVRKVHIRDARPRRAECTLDTTGFQLLDHKSEVSEFCFRS